MRQYRVFIVDEDGHVTKCIDLHCSNDAIAKDWAKVVSVDKHDVELWHRSTKIAVFKHETH